MSKELSVREVGRQLEQRLKSTNRLNLIGRYSEANNKYAFTYKDGSGKYPLVEICPENSCTDYNKKMILYDSSFQWTISQALEANPNWRCCLENRGISEQERKELEQKINEVGRIINRRVVYSSKTLDGSIRCSNITPKPNPFPPRVYSWKKRKPALRELFRIKEKINDSGIRHSINHQTNIKSVLEYRLLEITGPVGDIVFSEPLGGPAWGFIIVTNCYFLAKSAINFYNYFTR